VRNWFQAYAFKCNLYRCIEEAKHRTYLKGFTDGIMLLGAYKGEPVKIVKPKIKDMLLAAGTAIVYSEPEKQAGAHSLPGVRFVTWTCLGVSSVQSANVSKR
jgi:hypothetical protein